MRGVEVGQHALGQLNQREREWMSQLLDFLTTRSFSQLLRDVYGAYPDFATKSHFSN
jgi:hypothetical protein